ncbi:MAG: haloacid dehalogenase type II [Thermomicrobiales bacterium]
MTIDGITTLTFDCYGTLIDWEGGLGCFLYDLALRHGDERAPNGEALRRRWEAIQFGVIQEPFRLYTEVLAESLRRWCGERGYPCQGEDGEALARSMRSWQPFHETGPALRRLQEAGLRLAIMSNSQHSLIAHSIKQMGIEFDHVITAEDCGVYKPDDAFFAQSLATIGEAPERMLHVAFGFKYDIGPAQRFGWRTAWINRNAEPRPGYEHPDHIWSDLWGLAAFAGRPYDAE